MSESASDIARLSVLRCAATGAATLAVLFVLCWAPAAAGVLGVTHMYISLFTSAEVSSAAALAQGGGWSLAFGAAAGALTAIFFNVFGSLGWR